MGQERNRQLKARPVTLCTAAAWSGCLLVLLFAAGCAASKILSIAAPNPFSISGVVQTSQKPLAGSQVQLYVTGTEGRGSGSDAVLAAASVSGDDGSFAITGSYSCPSASAQAYLVATGGKPGSASGPANASIALMAALGPCAGLGSVNAATINEVTTVGSLWPLAAFATSATQIGAGSSDSDALAAANQTIHELVDISGGTSPGSGIPAGEVVPTAKLDTLANILAGCVESTGGTAGQDNACGRLFSVTTAAGHPAPTDTLAAALSIAQNPYRNISTIFSLSPSARPVHPALVTAPEDWTLVISAPPAEPTLSPDGGSLTQGQSVQIVEATTGADVYYTMDGSTPSAASQLYSVPIAVTGSATIRAVAIKDGVSSSVASRVFQMVLPITVALSPLTASVSQGQGLAFNVVVANSSNSAVNWSISPAVGSISKAGVYTAPILIANSLTIHVSAVSVVDPSKMATSSVSLLPVNVQISPASASIGQGQTLAFTASAMNSGDPGVTWTVSPAVGSISAAGVYTAPDSIATPQTVTVTASSRTDPTKAASSSLALVPPVAVTVSPASVSLTAGQVQAFSGVVSNSANTAVIWSVDPSLGSITAAGVYTAPAYIGTAQTLTVTAVSVADPTKSASASISLATPVVAGTTYYLSPTGNDASDGLSSATSWVTPNHPVNCGDVILAAPSNLYSGGMLSAFGHVSCASRDMVAWLKCAVFDGCKVQNYGGFGISVTQSYWGVQGFEVSVALPNQNGCFSAGPLSSTTSVHHIIFANNVANGCSLGGIGSSNNGNASVDYLVIVGNIAYNAGSSSGECFSGISIYQPVQTDSLAGTHIYVAGNFSYGNFDANPCAGGKPTDGEGIIFDTFDGSQGGLPSPYTAQAVATNNILVANGGRGFEVFENQGGTQHAHIYSSHNTMWGNNRDTNQSGSWCGEELIAQAKNVESSYDLAMTSSATGCGAFPVYAFYVAEGDASVQVANAWGFSGVGTTSGVSSAAGFNFSTTDRFGTDPILSNPFVPGAPNCTGSLNAPSCMAAVIAAFKPTSPAAAAFGYQTPSATPVSDPLFPRWVCNVNLPPGLVTMGCL